MSKADNNKTVKFGHAPKLWLVISLFTNF